MNTLGQIAYEAYFEACGSKLGGQEWFEKELPHIKAAWEATAQAVKENLLAQASAKTWKGDPETAKAFK